MAMNLPKIVMFVKTLEELIPTMDNSELALTLMGVTHLGTQAMAALEDRGMSKEDILHDALGVPEDVAKQIVEKNNTIVEGEEWKVGDPINPRIKPEWFNG